MNLIVRSPQNKPNVVEVRYDCACGCKPRARYQRGAAESGHEHCCCGQVHFVGDQAMKHLEVYLAERRERGEDADMQHRLEQQTVTAPWGEPVAVAFAIPDQPRKH